MRKKNKLFLLLAVCAALCVPAHAEDSVLSMDEAMGIILEHRGVETNMNVAYYLTLDAETMTREAAVTAVVRSYGVYPVDEPDYVWSDEDEHGKQYRPYIDYAKRMSITAGVGDGCFAPKQSVTEWELRTMLDRAEGIEPEYPLLYESPICKLLSADIQRGLSMAPSFLVDSFYDEGRTITATTNPIVLDDGDTLPESSIGWIWYEGDMWLAVTYRGRPCYDQDMTAIHELGHYLGHRTKLLNRYSVAAERDWLMEFFRDYCNESNHEFFADSFVAYILWPEEMAANAPTVYQHIETCLHEMKSDLGIHS
jgi:hypothetical protein